MAGNLPPLCRFCGRAIAKVTHRVAFGRPADERQESWRTARTERPRSKAEAQRYCNGEIVATRWARGEEWAAKAVGFDWITEVSTWDGERYRDRYFCKGDHAQRFAYACAKLEPTIGMKEYFDAIRARGEQVEAA